MELRSSTPCHESENFHTISLFFPWKFPEQNIHNRVINRKKLLITVFKRLTGSRSKTTFYDDVNESEKDPKMRRSSILVITIANATLGTEAAPGTQDGFIFRVGSGNTLCNFQQCQCIANLGRTLMKMSCDCTRQV